MDFRVSHPSQGTPYAASLLSQDSNRKASVHRTKRLKLSGRPVTCQAADLALGALNPHSSPRKVAIFVEPSPFSHVSGMKIRFTNLIKGLRDIGDDVCVFTPCVDPPKTFHGAKVGAASSSICFARGNPAFWTFMLDWMADKSAAVACHVQQLPDALFQPAIFCGLSGWLDSDADSAPLLPVGGLQVRCNG